MDEYQQGLEELKIIKLKCLSFLNVGIPSFSSISEFVNLYNRRAKIMEKMDDVYNKLEKYGNKTTEQLFKTILKYNSSGTYENLKNKLEQYSKDENISYEKLLLKLKFKGVIDKGSINGSITKEKVKGHNLEENEKEKIIKKVIELKVEGYNYCFCDHIHIPEVRSLRYINIFKYKQTYIIFGSSCIVEVPLLMKDNYKNIKIKKHLEKLQNGLNEFYNQYSNISKLEKAKLKYQECYKELQKIKEEINILYNEKRLERENLENERRENERLEKERIKKAVEQEKKKKLEKKKRIYENFKKIKSQNVKEKIIKLKKDKQEQEKKQQEKEEKQQLRIEYFKKINIQKTKNEKEQIDKWNNDIKNPKKYGSISLDSFFKYNLKLK